MKARHRADPLLQLKNVSKDDHERLRQAAKNRTISWNTKDEELSAIVASFRNEVKDYYFSAQRRRCCYCSFELQKHKLTYDAEHILDKDEYPEYMFELGNIASACKHCNISKSNQCISASKQRFHELSANSNEYSIVHPHFDEWEDHFQFDEIGRIVPIDNSSKGKATMQICKIDVINVARLSDEFSLHDKPIVEQTLRAFHEVDEVARKQELLEVISELASRYRHSGAKSIVAHLIKEIGSQTPPNS
jgi:uncharacterized protein (TIGR02646 family)